MNALANAYAGVGWWAPTSSTAMDSRLSRRSGSTQGCSPIPSKVPNRPQTAGRSPSAAAEDVSGGKANEAAMARVKLGVPDSKSGTPTPHDSPFEAALPPRCKYTQCFGNA